MSLHMCVFLCSDLCIQRSRMSILQRYFTADNSVIFGVCSCITIFFIHRCVGRRSIWLNFKSKFTHKLNSKDVKLKYFVKFAC